MLPNLGTGGTIAFIAVVVGFLIRLLKADKLNEALAKFGIPAVPKLALPWLALALGAGAMLLDSKIAGHTWQEAAIAAFYGLLAGAGAIAGAETVGNTTTKVAPTVGKVVFGNNPEPPKADAPADTPPAA